MNTHARTVLLLLVFFMPAAIPTITMGADPTLELITREPDWIARSPQNPRWLIDGSAIRFSQRRAGLVGRDFSDEYLLSMTDPDAPAMMITPDEPGPYMVQGGDWHRSGQLRLFTHAGDLFIYNVTERSSKQLTQTQARESNPMFLSDGSGYAFTRSGGWVIRSMSRGLEFDAAAIRFEDKPETDEEKEGDDDGDDEEDLSYLQREQRRLFRIIELEDQRDEMREDDRDDWRDVDPTGVSGPFYLGKGKRSQGSWLSPSGTHMIVASASDDRANNPQDTMPDYVNEDGYVSTRSVRPKVGHQRETAVEMVLLDLENEGVIELSFDDLPMIKDDPLAWLKDAGASGSIDEDSEIEDDPESEDERPTRPVSLMGVRWNDAGNLAAIMILSHDNKDRWIAVVDTNEEDPALICAHHLRDEAWIGWDFNAFGWIPGMDTLWYISEESGYGHLYMWEDGTAIQLTKGGFEVRDIRFTRDGESVFMRTNRAHPGVQELERFDFSDGVLHTITSMGGTVDSYRISPDETRVVYTWSNINSPPELYLLDLRAEYPQPRKLTHTITDEFRATNLMTPQIVAIPSTHTDQPIYTRVYAPDRERFPGPRPIVVFSHGAGYLQHANYEWSYYFREHMYHTILANRGFIVVAPDFRASSGYGRDWRTAIYRQMGYKELEDFKDAIDWAIEHTGGDPDRVGIYGGSYGGFMTLMAMFLEPETYTCGAALRSVTDWAHYNHGYTSNILNIPEIDPEAFEVSSPINHAEGLQGELLMLHGMLDDNVVAQDIIRLSQRLIELEKENWELALHPIEPHGYHEPSSWLDQMRRIDKLFMRNLAD